MFIKESKYQWFSLKINSRKIVDNNVNKIIRKFSFEHLLKYSFNMMSISLKMMYILYHFYINMHSNFYILCKNYNHTNILTIYIYLFLVILNILLYGYKAIFWMKIYKNICILSKSLLVRANTVRPYIASIFLKIV